MAIKLENTPASVKTTSEVSEEWGSGWKGTNFIVEIEETVTASPISTDYLNSREDVTSSEITNATNVVHGPKIIVRTEEVLIVGLVLMLWVGAIALFFNRWGKIRMLEPYQPKFQQQHRASCPLADIETMQTHQRSSVTRMSMGLVNNVNMPTCQFPAYNPTIYSKGNSLVEVSGIRPSQALLAAVTKEMNLMFSQR
uniref:Fibronectin type III domain-containing protein n=1 Tax=Glossina brevipalpis TaxID=37001 RepID=A0A1A9W9B9_9MUSC